ncbi:MAG: glycosyltransferase family 4 protein [Cyclobacteriaceae bacterium]
MNIKIVLNQPYPKGMASTHRVHLYAKGMAKLGHNVQILVPIPHSFNEKLGNKSTSGSHEGISYVYPSGTSVRSTSFIARRLHDLLGVLNAGWSIIKSKENTDAIILVSVVSFHIIFFKIISALSGSVYLTECNEYPFAFSSGKSLKTQKWYQKFYINWIIPQFDGLIVISNNLLNFYQERIRNKVQYALIPVLVDVAEFASVNVDRKNIVAYAGNLSDDKDGLYTQIRAFAKASQQIDDLEFYIIGNAQRPSTKEKALELIRELGIENKVKFTGFVSRKELVEIFRSASALMLFKPNSIQAEYCFPSKIAEYLAAQSPVVTTSTGELKNYLIHEQTALLSAPEDQEGLARNLIKALSDSNLAEKISQNGFEVAQKHFDYQAQSREIITFISRITNQDSQSITKDKELKTVSS